MSDSTPSSRRIPPGTVVLGVISVLTAALGFAREAVIAYFFGATAALDAFLVALSLPRLLVAQALVLTTAVVLPRYIALRQQSDAEAGQLMRQWARLLMLVMLGLCVLLALGAGGIMTVIGPGLSAEAKAQAAGWLRSLMPYVWLLAVAGCFKVILDSHQRFSAPAMSQAILSVAVISACVGAGETLGVGGMVYGFVGGALLSFAWQWLAANRVEVNLLAPARGRQDRVALPFGSAGLMLANSAAVQVTTLVDRAFASMLPEGSVAALNYATAIVAVPQTVFTSALATALFPVLSLMVARGEGRAAFQLANGWIIWIVAGGVLPVLVLISYRVEVVALLFQRGQFDAQAVAITASALSLLPIMIVVQAVSVILVRLFMAQAKLWLVVGAALATLGLKIALNIALIGPLGLRGLVLATVISGSIMAALRYLLAWRGNRAALAEATDRQS